MFRTLFPALAVAGPIVLVFFLHASGVAIPSSIDAPGKVMPAREWMLIKGRDGLIQTILQDHVRGTMQSYAVSQFERGDAISFNLHPSIGASARVAEGDTVGFIYSNETERQLAQLSGELSAALASLQLSAAGEKAPLVEVALQRLHYAQEQALEQDRIVQRMEALQSRGFVADEQFEVAQSTLRLYELGVSIAEAQLHSVRSGGRPEEIALHEARIQALEQEISLLQGRLGAYTLKAPIDGAVRRSFSGDTLLVLADAAAYVVLLPIRWQERHHVDVGQTVEVRMPGNKQVVSARLAHVEPTAHIFEGQQVVIATALVEYPPADLVPGLVVRCRLVSESVPVVEFIRRFAVRFFV